MNSQLVVNLTTLAIVVTVLATAASGIEKLVLQILNLQRTILKIYENQKIIDYRLTMIENRMNEDNNHHSPGRWLDDATNEDLEK